MNQRNLKGMLLAAATAAIATLVIQPLQAELLEKTKEVGDRSFITRPSFQTTMAILAFGGGPQTMDTVDYILNRNFRAEAERRGYIVVAPAAPDGHYFFEEGDRIFPEFLKLILADYKIRDNKFHIAGASNGGIAALHVAAGNPQYFLSVTAFPGYMWEPSAAKLESISKMCVFMYVGEHDSYIWHGEMKWEAHFLRERGTVVRDSVEEGQPHRMEKDQPHGIETLAGANAGRLFDGFEEISKDCSR